MEDELKEFISDLGEITQFISDLCLGENVRSDLCLGENVRSNLNEVDIEIHKDIKICNVRLKTIHLRIRHDL